MRPVYADPWLTVHGGDCREVMASMEPESVHCVVTSPPYWGLRDYGTATWVGGDESCDHLGPPRNQSDTSTPGIYADGTSRYRDGWNPEMQTKQIAMGTPYRDACRKCGATRQDAQIGLEPTPEAYVANMVSVFREVRRVLRDDGTVWLNLGDSYANTGGMTGGTNGKDGSAGRVARMFTGGYRPLTGGLKPKDLVGIPWRVAFALQADGWYLRSDIIWAKPNPMPESVTDRPTKAHEYLFLLSKSPRYYFDADAVREPDAGTDHPRTIGLPQPSLEPSGGIAGAHTGIRTAEGRNGTGRNIRTVWTVATQPYPGAHFATFPEKLVEPCILAGCPSLGTVLDPFAGSGTVGRVAQRLSRRAVLIDLNPEYLVQAMERNRDVPLGLGA